MDRSTSCLQRGAEVPHAHGLLYLLISDPDNREVRAATGPSGCSGRVTRQGPRATPPNPGTQRAWALHPPGPTREGLGARPASPGWHEAQAPPVARISARLAHQVSTTPGRVHGCHGNPAACARWAGLALGGVSPHPQPCECPLRGALCPGVSWVSGISWSPHIAARGDRVTLCPVWEAGRLSLPVPTGFNVENI